MGDCLFCAAVSGSLPVEAVYSSETVYAFLDHRPVFKGHVLVVPRAHVEVLADLPAEETGRLLGIAPATVHVHLHRALSTLRAGLPLAERKLP